jgi:peptide/nickel transport system substrate-binding protein
MTSFTKPPKANSIRSKRAALFIRMNDLACGDHAVIPLVYRPRVAAVSSKMKVDISGWDSDTGNLKDWYREA